MEPACIRLTDLPGTSKLFADFVYRPDRVRRFFPETAVDRPVPFPAERRRAIVEALRESNPGSKPLDELGRDGTVAVVTGQQAGLYGGPCYTIFKALSAVHLARQLSAAGRPAVPIFWVATEDHDFAEVDHVWTFGDGGVPHKLTATGDHQSQQPVGPVRISTLDDAGSELSRKHYRPGATFGEAFTGLVREVLGDYEVLFLDPLRPAIRSIAAPFLADAAQRSPRLHERLMQRNAALTEAGYHAQVLFEGKDASLFFALDGRKRRAVKAGDLAGWIPRAESLSPNALLRPVMQDYLLPTAAMIGGPAEIAYLAQSAALYEELLGRQPKPMPRAGFTLLDERASKLMDRFGLRLPDIAVPESELHEKIAARLAPPELKRAFADARAELDGSLDRVSRSLGSFDSTLAESFAKSRRKIAYQLSKAEAKAARETLRRDERARAGAEYLANSIFPHRHLQERFYSILPFLDRHPGLVKRVYESIHLDCPDHHLLPL